jgi:ABC-2 type transport system ATP-binding protein
MLIVSKINKYFGDYNVTKDISFTIKQGSIFGLLGPNGAGKTTLLRIITGIYAYDSGSITWQGSPISIDNSSLIGYLPEEHGLYPKMRIIDIIIYFAEIKGVNKSKKLLYDIDYYLKKFGIYEDRNKRIEQISKGMQQKVQIISTIIHNPDLIIFDEPFSGLDPVNSRILKELMLELAQNGKTIIFSTHRMEQVEELCQNIILIDHGQEVLSGNIEEIQLSYRNQTYFIKTKDNLIDHIPGDIISKTDNTVIFKNENKNEVKSFLKESLSKYDVLEFREILPTMEDIFVKVIEENNKI